MKLLLHRMSFCDNMIIQARQFYIWIGIHKNEREYDKWL